MNCSAESNVFLQQTALSSERRHRADWSGIAGAGIEAATSATTLGSIGWIRDSLVLQLGLRGGRLSDNVLFMHMVAE